MRKLGFFLLLLLLLSFTVFFAVKSLGFGSDKAISNYFDYIPETASLIFIFDDYDHSFQQLSQSEYGHHFTETRFVQKLNNFRNSVNEMDKIYLDNEQLNNNKEIVSLHLISAKDYGFVTVIPIVDEKKVEKALEDSSCGESQYLGQRIFCLQTTPKLYATFLNKHCVLSGTSYLAEDAIKQFKSGNDNIENIYSKLKLADTNANDLHVLTNVRQAKLLLPLVVKDAPKTARYISKFSSWLLHSVQFDAQSIQLIGKSLRANFKADYSLTIEKDSLQNLYQKHFRTSIFSDTSSNEIEKEFAGVIIEDRTTKRDQLSKIILAFGDLDIQEINENLEEIISEKDSTKIEKDSVLNENQTGKQSGQNIVWSYQPKEELASWNHIIHNHRTDRQNIVLQNQNNELILLNQNGVEKWRKQLDGRLIGRIKQMDIYQNGKLQMLFNTRNSVYLIDILGRDVTGFPIKLKLPATGELSYVQYENGKYRRFFVPTEQGILGFKESGVLLNEFHPNTVPGEVHFPLQYSSCSGSDILVTTNVQNEVFIMNRRGQLRVPKVSVKSELLTPFVFEENSGSCRLIAVAENNEVYSISLDGNLKKVDLSRSKALAIINGQLNSQSNLVIDQKQVMLTYQGGNIEAKLTE